MTTPNENAPNTIVEGAPEAKVPEAKGGGAPTAAPEWIPADLKESKTLWKFKDPIEAARGYVNVEAMAGKRVEIPADDAPAEVKNIFRARMGVPAKAEEYDNPALPEGVSLDATVVAGAKAKMLELGIPKSAAKGLMDWFVNMELSRASEMQAERQTQHKAGMDALNTRWGAAAPRQIALCQRVVAEIGGPKVKEALNASGAGNDPAVVEFLAKIGSMLEEDGMIMPVQVGVDKDAAIAKIAQIRTEGMKDRKGPLMNKSHPGHAAVVKELGDLHRIAYPEMQGEDGA